MMNLLLPEPEIITIDEQISDYSGFEISVCGSDGSIDLTISGGKDYTFLWQGSGVNPTSEDQSGFLLELTLLLSQILMDVQKLKLIYSLNHCPCK